MRNLITLIAIAAAGILGWQYQEANNARIAAETKLGEINAEHEKTKTELKAAMARLAQFARPGAAGAARNWVEEQNRKWVSPLSAPTSSTGTVGGRGHRGAVAMSTPVPTPAPTTQPATFFTDAQGRYWLDAAGAKHYLQ